MHLASTSVEALNVLDPRSLLSGLGALGVFLVLFAETGLLCATAATAPLHLSCPRCSSPPRSAR